MPRPIRYIPMNQMASRPITNNTGGIDMLLYSKWITYGIETDVQITAVFPASKPSEKLSAKGSYIVIRLTT